MSTITFRDRLKSAFGQTFFKNKTRKNSGNKTSKNKTKKKSGNNTNRNRNTPLETTFRTYFDKIQKFGITPLDFLNKFYETVNSQTIMVTEIIENLKKTKQTSYRDSVIMPLMKIAKQLEIDFKQPENYFLLLAANLMVLIYTTRNPTADNLWKIGKGGMPEIKKTFMIFSPITFKTFNSELNKWFARSYGGQPIEQIFVIDEKKLDPTNNNNKTYPLDRILNKIQIIDRTGVMESYQNLNDDDKTYVFIRAYFRKNPSNVPIVLPTKLSVNLLPYFSEIKTVMDKDKELYEFQGEIGTNVPSNNNVAAVWASAARGPELNLKNKPPTVYVSPLTNTKRFNEFKEGMKSDPSSAAARPNYPIYDEPGNNSTPFNIKSGTGNVNNLTTGLKSLSMVNDPTYNTVEEPQYVGYNPAPPLIPPKNKKSGPSKKPDLNNIPENNEPTEPVYGSLGVTRDPTSEGYASLKQEPVYATINNTKNNTGSTPYASPSNANKNVNVGAFQGERTAIDPSAIVPKNVNVNKKAFQGESTAIKSDAFVPKNVNVGAFQGERTAIDPSAIVPKNVNVNKKAFQGERTAINPNKVFGEPLGKPQPYHKGNNFTFNSSEKQAIPQIRKEYLNKFGMPIPPKDDKLKTPTLHISNVTNARQALESLPSVPYSRSHTFANEVTELPSLNEFQKHALNEMSLRNQRLTNNTLHNTSLLNNNKPQIKGSLEFLPPNKNNGPQLQGPVSVSLPYLSVNQPPETRSLVPASSKKILIPGKIFNEVTSGVSGQFADKPGKGSTASKQACGAIFDFEKQFDEDDFLRDCLGKNVLIVSHNKRLQQLIGDMFPKFARQQSKKEDGCKFGIANCSVLEIYNTESEAEKSANYPNLLSINDPQNALPAIQAANANREQQSKTQQYFKLRVLFDGFPDKSECNVEIKVKGGAYTRKRGKKGNKVKKGTRRQRGGASSYHYLKKGDETVLGEFLTKDKEEVMRLEPPTDSLFEKMFQAGAQKIILMRHGNGPHNGPYSDKTIINPPLTALGVYQASLAGQALNDEGNLFDLDNLFVTTSQLKRAQQTTLQFLVSIFEGDHSNFISDCKSCLTKVYNVNTINILRNKPFYKLLDNLNLNIYNLSDFLDFVYDNELVSETNYKRGIASFEAKRQKKLANAAHKKTAKTIANSLKAARAEAEQQKEIDKAKAEQQKLMKKYKPFECWRFLNRGNPVQVIINQVIPNQIIYQTWNIELEKYNEEETIMSLRDFDNLPGLKKLKMCPDIALQDVKSAAYRPPSPSPSPSPSVGTVHRLSKPVGFSGIRRKEGRPTTAPESTFPFSNNKSSLGFTKRRRLGRISRKAARGGKQKTKKRIKKTKNGKKNEKKKLITKRKNRRNHKKRTRKC